MSLLDRVSRFIDDVLLLPEDVRDRLEAAEDALEAGEHAVAAELFERVLEERDTLARAAVGLAQAREALGDLRGAARSLERARTLEPDDPEVALFDARLALGLGETERAATAARDAAGRLSGEGGPRLARACVLRARAERQRGRPDRAARELRKALSLTEDDMALRAELVEVLAEAHRVTAARAAATGLDPSALDDAAATRLGLALERVGAHDLSREWLERGAEAGSDTALLALARIALSKEEVEEAEAMARRAVARGAGTEALTLLAEILGGLGRRAEAAEAYAAAAHKSGGSPDLLRRAVRVAPTDRADLLTAHADALERVSPGDVAARAARAFVALETGDLDTARALAHEGSASEPRLTLARARLALALEAPRDALTALAEYEAEASRARGAASDEDLCAAIRRDALRALWLDAEGQVDLAAAIDAVERFAAEHGLDAAERGAAKLRDELDRPLLLAVLGEFNAGKSTFINAFVGAPVAPTGIVPTTATLNVLRGGAERLVRVVRADGTTREGGYDDLARLLEEAADQGKRDSHTSPAVDHVEIVLPSEILERVWIIDTPGTNAIDPEHERLAREAARRADAALWIFSAGQAGKDTEAKMLGAIRASGRLVVPILNKVDRLSEAQLEEVMRSLEEELGADGAEGSAVGMGTPIPVSAKRALLARVAEDEEGFAASGYEALLDALGERVFARTRELKRGACAGRLVEIVDAALATEADELATFEARLARLDEAGELLSPARTGGVEMALERAVDESITHLSKDLDVAFVQAAEEVLAFVRPRRSRFASHGADPEDRAFLAEALERRLGQAADGLSTRLLPRARAALSEPAVLLALSHEELDRRVRAAVMQPLSLYVGYQRGVLRGGGLRRFFEDYLPSATLEVDGLAKALGAVRANPRTELAPALEDSLRELVVSLGRERESLVDEARIAREKTAATVFGPLRALRAVLAEALR